MRYGVHTSPSSNNPQLPDCESQYLGSASDLLHPVCLRGRPDTTTLDFWRNLLSCKRLLHADFSGGIAHVSDNYQREQVFFNRATKRKCDNFQPAPNKNHAIHPVVLSCCHRYSTEFRVGSLRVFRLARDLFYSSWKQLLLHELSRDSFYCSAVFRPNLVLHEDLPGFEKKQAKSGPDKRSKFAGVNECREQREIKERGEAT